jgi:CRP-like cAMP-binding protein
MNKVLRPCAETLAKQAIPAYLNAYRVLCPELTEAEQDFLAASVVVADYKSRALYLQAGVVQNAIGFVYAGLLRSFYIDSDGNDITMGFVKENDYATDCAAFVARQPSRYAFQCLEPCIIVDLPYTAMADGFGRFKNLETYGRRYKEQVLAAQQARIEACLVEEAEQRYLNFVRQHPDLFGRVSLTHLASYLGIERQSLSRIRKKLADRR